MTKKKVVIIGAGLGGCYLASSLLSKFDVTIIELGSTPPPLRDRIVDKRHPAVTYPNIESGFGGTTKLWHNALMEIDAAVFESYWPFLKDELRPYYDKAYIALSGASRQEIDKLVGELRAKLIDMGIDERLLRQSMFIPRTRVNAWQALSLQGKVRTLEGEVTDLIPSECGDIARVKVRLVNGETQFIASDYFVLAAGGLGSPLLLQDLAKHMVLKTLQHAGHQYEDHVSVFVGEIELDKPLYMLWNYPVRTRLFNASLRIPLSLFSEGLNVSFQLRPSHQLVLGRRRQQIESVINDLRNFPFRISNYWRLFTHIDDIFDILSFRFGLRFSTKRYSILMCAEKPPSASCKVYRERGSISRHWNIEDSYISRVDSVISEFLRMIKPITKSVRLFDNWSDNIVSSCHHSGSARMAGHGRRGVCDPNGQVRGISNLFVCDGSVLPGSGFVNTGLTIVALALRLGDYLNSIDDLER